MKKELQETGKFALKPDAQAFDEIRLKTVERFKDSHYSGSEWRIQVNVEFYRKGELIVTGMLSSNMETACGHAVRRIP